MKTKIRYRESVVRAIACGLVTPLLLVGAGCSGRSSESELEETSAAATSRSLSGPYVWWSWPGIVHQEETDLTFSADPGSSTTYFLAHQFDLVDASAAYQTGGYIGLQTQTAGTGGQKGIVFSIWNATTATAGSGTTCQPFSGEGVGMQCFRAYAWAAGKTYRLRVSNDGALGYSGYVVDESTTPPTETYLGQIQAPSGVAGFGGSSVQWAEYYGAAPSSCSGFPYVKALWSRPSGNGGSVVPANAGIAYGGGYCKSSAVIPSGSANYLEVGTPGTVSLRNLLTSLNKYVYPVSTSDGCGGGGIRADIDSANACTQLARVALPSGKVALQVEDGYYVSCAGGGGSTVSATARTITSAESFTETSLFGKLLYQSASGRYLTAVNGGGGDVRCDAYFAGLNELFTAR